jgi:hypothetical protein
MIKKEKLKFRFRIGQTVEHKLGWQMVVINQEIRITTEGTENYWYLCRTLDGGLNSFAEKEFK